MIKNDLIAPGMRIPVTSNAPFVLMDKGGVNI